MLRNLNLFFACGEGKTIQTVCFLHQLRSMQSTRLGGPFIVVAPLSLIDQWQSEVSIWSPQMNCIVYHGSTEARELIVRHEFHFQEPFVSKSSADALKRVDACKFNILLTTYEIAIKDIRVLSKVNWEVRSCVDAFSPMVGVIFVAVPGRFSGADRGRSPQIKESYIQAV